MAERFTDFNQKFFDKFLKTLNTEDLIVYPKDSLLSDLKKNIANHYNCFSDQVLLDCGSDGLIRNILHSLTNTKDEIVISFPSFPMYKIYAETFGLNVIEVPYRNRQFDITDLIDSISPKTQVVFLANPNSPFGDIQELSAIEELLDHLSILDIYLVIDEAYIDFSEASSAVKLVKKYHNLVVLQTFSKGWGAAGIRLGFCISQEKNLEVISRVQLTYPVTNISIKFAIYLFENIEIIQNYAKNSTSERDLLVQKLNESGYEVLSSNTNSIHFYDKDPEGKKVRQIFQKYCVSVKTGSDEAPIKVPGDDRNDWIRMSLGQGILEMDYIKEILSA